MKEEQTSEKNGIMKQAQIIKGTGIEEQVEKESSDIGIKHTY